MGVIRVKGVWRGGYKALVRVLEGLWVCGWRRLPCRTEGVVREASVQGCVRLHSGALRVWSEDCRGTVRVLGGPFSAGLRV